MPVAPDDVRLARCGYARLLGDGGKLDFIMRRHEVLLGRPSKGKAVDVGLDHKAVSREHARIRYSAERSESAACLLSCLLEAVSVVVGRRLSA